MANGYYIGQASLAGAVAITDSSLEDSSLLFNFLKKVLGVAANSLVI